MECVWKGMKTVVLENELLRVEILADKGTDIVEFRYKPADVDFMFRSRIPVYEFPKMIPSMPGKTGNFMDYFPGGWQEIFPNAGGPCEYKGALLGLHGEVALLPWEYRILEDSPKRIAVRFSIVTCRLPFRVEKTVTLEANSPALVLEETVTNLAGEPMEFMWGHHPAFGKPFLSGDCVIRIKKASVMVAPGDGESFSNLKQGAATWPFVPGSAGGKVDISKCPAEKDNVSEIMFLTDLAEGSYEIVNRKIKAGFRLEFPKSVFKTLWFWRVAGGSYHYPWFGMNYNVALEPFSGLPNLADSVQRGDALKLAPGKHICATVTATAVES